VDSYLVELLRKDGCSQKQAAAFERWLEDSWPVGIGPAKLSQAIQRSMWSECIVLVASQQEMQRRILTLEAELRSAAQQQQFDFRTL
jgi:hypothetical protein